MCRFMNTFVRNAASHRGNPEGLHPPLKKCKKCRGKLEKIFSRTSFQLKGSGWYDDY